MADSFDGKSRVLEAVNLVELIGKTVSLKRRGKNYIGLCPFHSEKTPSFTVDPAKQYFRCYGCKETGNAIDFVMKRDRLTFVDALRQLAEEYNVELPRAGASSRQNVGERQLMLEAHSAAGALFEKLLSHPQHGAAARAYLGERGFTAESISRFQIGLSLDAWDTLAKSAAMKKFAPALLAQAGLLKSRERGGEASSGFYDTFRNRLMFPIRDENARIIAFGGRVMPGSQDPAKYLNSPETPLFSKGKSVFGIDLARQKIVETRTVAVVEGYTDVVMAHQFGATNVVSVLGTAMTEGHVALLRRFADRIVLMFDPDTAGETAVARAVELFLSQPIEIAIATIPDDLDPDEFLLKNGVEAFNEIIASAADALTFKWRQLARSVEGNDLTARQKAVRDYLDLIAGARSTSSGPIDPIRWGQILSRVSRLTEMPVEELNRMFRPRAAVAKRSMQPADEPVADVVVDRSRLNANDRARRWIVGTLLVEPHRWHEVQKIVDVNALASADVALTGLANQYWSHQRDEGEPVLNEFLSLLDDRAKSLAVELVEEVEGMEDLDRTLSDAIEQLHRARQRREERQTMAALRRTDDSAGAPQTADEQTALLVKLQEQMRRPDLSRAPGRVSKI